MKFSLGYENHLQADAQTQEDNELLFMLMNNRDEVKKLLLKGSSVILPKTAVIGKPVKRSRGRPRKNTSGIPVFNG